MQQSHHPPPAPHHHHPSVTPLSSPCSSSAPQFLLIHLFCHICSLSLICQLFPPIPITFCSLGAWLSSLSLIVFPFILFFSLGQTSGVLLQFLCRLPQLLYWGLCVIVPCTPPASSSDSAACLAPLCICPHLASRSATCYFPHMTFSTSFCNHLSASYSLINTLQIFSIPFKGHD